MILYEAFIILIQNIHWVAIGVLVGMCIGLMPGMGGLVTISILIPLTFGMDKYSAFALLSGGVGATSMSGSITSILINVPGSPSNVATVIDGYKLAQKGQASLAISASAVASATGALVAITIFILSIPFLLELALLFGPAEISWLIVYAFLIIPLVIGDRPVMGILMTGLGALFAFMGRAPQSGLPRFTFGVPALTDGLHIMSMIVGLFALAEIYKLASTGRGTIATGPIEKVDSSLIVGLKTVFKHKWLWFRCALIGTIVGAIPAAGGSAVAFISYGHAVQSSPNNHEFGQGRIEGVIAPESANDAKDGGQLIPTLGLGIPGSATMAVFLGGLVLHGIFPGPRLLIEETHLVLLIAFAILASNFMTSIVGLLFTNQFTRILSVPLNRIIPIITILALGAVFIVRFTTFDLVIALGFGVLGIVLMYFNISRVPLILAYVLAPILDQNYYLAMAFQSGDYVAAFFSGALNFILIGAIVLSFIVFTAPGSWLERVPRPGG